jgi:hypothetical protein
MSIHLTPSELADEMEMQRREVIARCREMNVPILHGRIDRTLFEASLRHASKRSEPSGYRLNLKRAA